MHRVSVPTPWQGIGVSIRLRSLSPPATTPVVSDLGPSAPSLNRPTHARDSMIPNVEHQRTVVYKAEATI